MTASLTPGEERERYRKAFWILLGCVTVFRLVVAGLVGLSTDESHYALYARHLDWGYFDHPPMVGWLAALTTAWNNDVFFLRLGPILCGSGSLILLRRLALRLFEEERIAFRAVVLVLVTPMQHLLGIALLPDATLNLFWCGALLVAWRALRGGLWWRWIQVGLLFGGALLSKYHAVLFPVCLLGYVVSSRTTWKWLRSPQPYVAGLVGLAVFLPNVIWNWRHEWISYAFQLKHGGGGGYFSIGKLMEMMGGQLAAASPVLLVIAIVEAVRMRPMTDGMRFALWSSVPVFVFFCGVGLFGKILPHWTAVGWWGGALVLSAVLDRNMLLAGRSGVRWRRWAVAGGAVGLAMIVAMHAAVAFPIVEPAYEWARGVSMRMHDRFPRVPAMGPFRGKYDLTNDMYGWEEAAKWVEGVRVFMPHPDRTFVFSHRFYTTSQLAVHLGAGTVAGSLHRKPSQYDLWFDPAMHKGWDALFVDDERWAQGPDRYKPLFERIDAEPIPVRVLRKGRVAHRFCIYRCYGHKGRGRSSDR